MMKYFKHKDYGNINLNNYTDAADYFIFLTEHNYRLALLILKYSSEDYTMAKFNYEYFEKRDFKEKSYYTLKFVKQFYNTFVNKSDNFIFSGYFYDNQLSTDTEKKSKLSRIIHNLNSRLQEIHSEIEMKDFRHTDDRDLEVIARFFEKKYNGNFICFEDDGKTIIIKYVVYKFFLYCIGLKLKLILEKINIDFNAFIDTQDEIAPTNLLEPTTSLKLNTTKNPNPRIFINNESFYLFEELRKEICNKQSTSLADYSFVFRILHKNGKIYKPILESEFRDFLDDNYDIVLDKLKTLNNCSTDSKVTIYNIIESKIKPN